MSAKEIIYRALGIAEEVISSVGSSYAVYEKESSRDYATDIDILVEKKISEYLIKSMPGIPVVGEELTSDLYSDNIPSKFWVIDPIDGTANFSRNVPLFGVCIALIEDGQAIASGISFPLLQEKYFAAKGNGAYVNGNKICVSKNEKKENAIAGMGDFAVGKDKEVKNKIRNQIVCKLGSEFLRIRMLGSAAMQLAWLAAGRIDLSVTMSNKPWDVQAGVLMVREAGGCVFDRSGCDHTLSSNETLASNNSVLKAELLSIIEACQENLC